MSLIYLVQLLNITTNNNNNDLFLDLLIRYLTPGCKHNTNLALIEQEE